MHRSKDLGYRAIIILGHPDYYPRVGFRRAEEFGITTSDGKNFDPFMVYPPYEGALTGIHGKYHFDPVYESLTKKDTLAFDKQFPAKEPFVSPSIDVLLNRLPSSAADAIRTLDFSALGMMQSKSEREILSLDGITPDALETIRAVMREHSLKWGRSN